MAKFLIRDKGAFLEAEPQFKDNPAYKGCSYNDLVEIVLSDVRVEPENLVHFGTEPTSFYLNGNGSYELMNAYKEILKRADKASADYVFISEPLNSSDCPSLYNTIMTMYKKKSKDIIR